MSKLDRLNAFISVVECQGFNAAAKKLELSAAAISRQISALENDLGSRLLHRTTRHVKLTDTGKLYYDECKKTLQHLTHIESCITQQQTEPLGDLRVTASRYFAENFILPHLPEFCRHYPKINLHLELAERFPDLMQENINILFGTSAEGAMDLVRRRVMTTRYVLCASPGYLKKHGTPRAPKDLLNHAYITHSMRQPADEICLRQTSVKVKPSLWLNDVQAMTTAAINGMGIVSLHCYAITNELREKKLIEVLKPYGKAPQSVYLYYLKDCYMKLKIRVFIDFFVAKIEAACLGK